MEYRRRLKYANTDDEPKHPNHLVYNLMEEMVRRMLKDGEGVPIRTVKSFLSKIPSVFTGVDLINWLFKYVPVADLAEAIHLAHLLACHGYLFPIDDHILTVKNDGTFYRFQTPYFWPSNCWEPENTDYAVYLCKRTMQNKAHLELEDFEAENLAKLQRMFARKWEFIFMQAEAQYKVDKRRDRLERQILDSQERAFWDVHRPVPGCVSTTEVDFRKISRAGRPKRINSADPSQALAANAAAAAASAPSNSASTSNAGPSTPAPLIPGSQHWATLDGEAGSSSSGTGPAADAGRMQGVVNLLNARMAKSVVKTSKVAEAYMTAYESLREFDAFFKIPDPPSPWLCDSTDFWDVSEVSQRRASMWGLSFETLVQDTAGRETLQKFLDKEYSGENLRFWWAVQELRKASSRMVPVKVTEIYAEFLAPSATFPVNVDAKVADITEENLKNPNRWSFDEAADHIYCLMKNDSYQRFLRSDIYKALLDKKQRTAGSSVSGKVSNRLQDVATGFFSQKPKEPPQ